MKRSYVQNILTDSATFGDTRKEQAYKRSECKQPRPVEDGPTTLPTSKFGNHAFCVAISGPYSHRHCRQGDDVIPDTRKQARQREHCRTKDQEKCEDKERQPHIDIGQPFDAFANT